MFAVAVLNRCACRVNMRVGGFVTVCAREIEDKTIFRNVLETPYFSSYIHL